MAIIQKILQAVDNWQLKHQAIGFIYAVFKKYSQDQVGYQAVLLTYYGFLSLFPLFLILTTVLGVVANDHPQLRETVTHGITTYFPILGGQLSTHIQTLHKSGLALIIGILFMLYGARGVAGAFRHGVNHIWQTEEQAKLGFLPSLAKNMAIILVGGLGFILASLISGYASAVGRGLVFHSLSIGLDLIIFYGLFLFLINISLPSQISLSEIRVGAATAALGLVVLQSLGGYLLAHELRTLDALYSSFAIVLGLLFWIYLQVQVLYLAIEIAVVRSRHLWPRSFLQ
ncbi:MAG TPA: YihY/virulence factor BrkB family protein [Candidatus Dormibacteraeota bacterium]|nr:YihY/virulence factor BrkB family protein [Candidatus Dormibacteraeota bacterium]